MIYKALSQAEFECFESRHVKKRFFGKSAVTRFCQRANDMAWNFHLFSNLVSICCETYRNVLNSDLSFLGLFQFVSVDLLYNLYVSMFRNNKYMAWNFHLFSSLVSICCETFRNVSNSDLVIFGSVSLCFI